MKLNQPLGTSAYRCPVARVTAIAEAKMETADMEGKATVAFSRIQEARWYLERFKAQVTTAKASPCGEVTSKRRRSDI